MCQVLTLKKLTINDRFFENAYIFFGKIQNSLKMQTLTEYFIEVFGTFRDFCGAF